MRQLGLGLLLAAMLVSAPVLALDGNEFLDRCRKLDEQTPNGFAARGYCLGFTSGIVSVMQNHEIYGFNACIPGNVRMVQIRDVVLQFLKDNPGKRHLEASSIVAGALSDAFPC